MFDGEERIALYAMQGNRASSHGEGEVSWFFSSWGGNQGIYSSYGGDCPSKLVFVSEVMTRVVTSDTLGISLRLCRAIGTLLEVRLETQGTYQLPQEYWDS